MKPEPTIEAQLQERELGKLVLKSSGFFEKYGLTLLAVVAAVIVATIGYMVYESMQRTRLAAAWSEMEGVKLPADMEALAERLAGTPAGDWALLRAAELRFDEGMLQANRNREAANSEFKQSKAGFEKVLAGAAYADVLRERAIFGLARVLEATSTGDTKPAITKYEELVAQFPTSIFKPIAEERAKALNSPQVQDFYSWYSQQNPKPEAPTRPRDGMGNAFGFPGLDLPGMTPPAGASGGSTSPVKSTEGEIPPPVGEKPAAEKPAADMPADPTTELPPAPAAAKPESPAAPATPTTTPPAAEKSELPPAP
jgi:hypothetical protein